MKLGKIIGLILVFLSLGALVAVLVNYFLTRSKPSAGLRIETTPPSTVFIDDLESGRTPFEKQFLAREVLVKLIPDSTDAAIPAYQTRLQLSSGVTSIIRRHFSSLDTATTGESLSFQPDPAGGSSISVITSDPDSATIYLDGRLQGLSPFIITDTLPGEHQLALSAPGYQPQTISFKNPSGFRTQISAKLAKIAILSTPVPESATSSSVKSVKISSTPTGFLRVRATPNSSAAEVGQVKPGEIFPLLNQLTGWYQIKIDLESTTSGWVSSQYSTLTN